MGYHLGIHSAVDFLDLYSDCLSNWTGNNDVLVQPEALACFCKSATRRLAHWNGLRVGSLMTAGSCRTRRPH